MGNNASVPSPISRQREHAPLLSSYTLNLLAGGLAGTAVDLSLYPLDTIKTRLQQGPSLASTLQKSSIAKTASAAVSPPPWYRGIYSGIGSVIAGSAPGAALFFVTYEESKRLLSHGKEGHNTPIQHMISASFGEIAACAVRVPTEVVKQRAQASHYSGSLNALKDILFVRSRGKGVYGLWNELYRGWGITIMREIPFTVIQFPIWEGLKSWRRGQKAANEVSVLESAFFGSIAGGIAAGLTTPLDVLKTRLMLAKQKHSVVGMLRKILQEEGFRALWAGTVPRVTWISIGGAIFLGAFDAAKRFLEGL